MQGSIIVADHQISVFAHYMYLLNLLLVEFIERTIVVLLIAQAIVLQSTNVHSIIEHKKSTFELQRSYLRKVEQCFLHIFQLQICRIKEEQLSIRLNIIKQFYYRKLYCSTLLCLIVHTLSHTVEPVHDKTADVQTLFKSL